MGKKVSIVICTYNRVTFLKRTLKSLENLRYKNFEVIVVNGPSTDGTDKILDMYNGKIKVATNPITNLSISRNIGIKLSAGEIIAFIDDDAIPDENWLNDIISMYSDETVGGVGGRVYGPGDDHFQFENGYVDIWGDADVHCQNGSNYNNPKDIRYNMMLGTNCTFLKKALIDVGGFDEYYEYFHDESDLCLRVVRAGYKILHHPQAYIHHEFAASHIRKNTFDCCRLNWFPIIKNKIYFALQNSKGFATDAEREEKVLSIKQSHIDSFKKWRMEKKISNNEYKKFVSVCLEAYEQGYRDGKSEKPRKFNFDLENETCFLKFEPNFSDKVLSICLLSKDDIFCGFGGIAKYTFELAKGFVNKGHDVHVITAGDRDYSWLQDGINMHSIKNEKTLNIKKMDSYPTSYNNLQYSYNVYKQIQKLRKKYSLDIIESPLWDFEGSVVSNILSKKIPVIIRLQTPLLKVAETCGWKINDDLKVFAQFEKQMLLDATGIIKISDHIQETIEDMYDIEMKDKIDKVYLGVDKPDNTKQNKHDGMINILFIGRLERRKGIHTIFDAIPNVLEKHKNVRFIFLGDHTEKDNSIGDTFKNQFHKMYKNKNWFDQVIFLGKVSNDEKANELRNCDILIAPSLYESFGIILIEAMSYGKPVIGCRIGGMQEIIDDNVTGFLIDVEDHKSLENKINKLVVNKNIREKIGMNAFNRFEQMFSNEVMVENTLQIYRKYIKFKNMEENLNEKQITK